MPISRICPRVLVLLAGCTLFANALLSSGCAEMPRYPALVVTEPNFVRTEKGGDVTLNLDVIGRSDSELWKDFGKLAKDAKHWRVNVFKFSDDSHIAGFDWKTIGEKTQKLERIPLETLMRGDADFCSSDDPDAANADQKSRSYIFLLHKYPE